MEEIIVDNTKPKNENTCVTDKPVLKSRSLDVSVFWFLFFYFNRLS